MKEDIDVLVGVVVFVVSALVLTLGLKHELLPTATLISGVFGSSAAVITDKLRGD